jgi:type I restriction-modification system DNA methylase subunit
MLSPHVVPVEHYDPTADEIVLSDGNVHTRSGMVYDPSCGTGSMLSMDSQQYDELFLGVTAYS